MYNNNISGNAPYKNRSSSSSNAEDSFVIISSEKESKDRSINTNSFVKIEAATNTSSPMGNSETDPAFYSSEFSSEDEPELSSSSGQASNNGSPRFIDANLDDEDSYSLSDDYENGGNDYSITNTESSEKTTLAPNTLLEEPRPLELVLEHLNTLHKKFPDVFLSLIFDNQVPETLEERREYLLTRFTKKLQLLEESTNREEQVLLAYQLKVYMIVLRRRYQVSIQRISKHIKKEYPQGEALLNKRFLRLLDRFARIQYDYPICKRKIAHQPRNIIKNQSSEDTSLYTSYSNIKNESSSNINEVSSDIESILVNQTELISNLINAFQAVSVNSGNKESLEGIYRDIDSIILQFSDLLGDDLNQLVLYLVKQETQKETNLDIRSLLSNRINYLISSGKIQTTQTESKKQPQFSVKDELDDASALESHILSQTTINKLVSSPLNEIIDSLVEILKAIVKNPIIAIDLRIYIRETVIKISKMLDNKLIDFFYIFK